MPQAKACQANKFLQILFTLLFIGALCHIQSMPQTCGNEGGGCLETQFSGFRQCTYRSRAFPCTQQFPAFGQPLPACFQISQGFLAAGVAHVNYGFQRHRPDRWPAARPVRSACLAGVIPGWQQYPGDAVQ